MNLAPFRISIVVVSSLFFTQVAHTIPTADKSEIVPVSRLLANAAEIIKKHPNESYGYGILGRTHSIAFTHGIWTSSRGPSLKAQWAHTANEAGIKAPGTPEEVIKEGYRYNARILGHVPGAKLTSRQREHLEQSIRNYTIATELSPSDYHCTLGLAWMLEQGTHYAKVLGSPWATGRDAKISASPKEWQERTLQAYRQAYVISAPTLDSDYNYEDLGEAAIGVLRLLSAPDRFKTPAEEAEIKVITARLKRLAKIPIFTSPIILPLGKSTSLNDLLSKSTSVTFDLAGNGLSRKWPWLSLDTGILVWDPERKGNIRSGRQLFGFATWWMFWKNGYEALAALDNDENGALTGKELQGISIWRDANGNGVSDFGEVKPISDWGFTSLAVKATNIVEGMPSNLNGAMKRNGTVVPTYDWTPRSLN
ncbi:hypothetical protein EON80_08210 [bacterium]|nr:MAG: hypothetical protein EON80_08210 [bacterium]